MVSKKISNDWWPKEILTFMKVDPLSEKMITVAEITKPFDQDSDWQLYTALIPTDKLNEVFDKNWYFSHPMDTSGPHPGSIPSGKPWFKIKSKKFSLEPIVVTWEDAGHRMLIPDQGFLMTYGLIPRVLDSEENDKISWDDLNIPQYDVVVSKSTSESYYKLHSPAYVRIHSDYLQDYATSRDMAIIQLYFIHSDIEEDDEIKKILNQKESIEEKQKGRTILIAKNSATGKFYCQSWGVRQLFTPGLSPIIKGYFQVGNLNWPGISEAITRQNYSQLALQYVYVKDNVLGKYEERPDLYEIDPESGGVSYGGQWGVGYCRRVGRDLIAIEAKKLYGGNPEHVIKHWHDHSVNPPNLKDSSFKNTLNVASRSKRIAEALFRMGTLLSEVYICSSGEVILPENITGYNENDLRYKGIWTNPYLLRLTFHIPLEMSENAFLQRCIDLENAIIEGIKESFLRKLLLQMGMDGETIKKFGSLKLFYVLLAYAKVSIDTGLDLINDFDEINHRRIEIQPKLDEKPYIDTPLNPLFMLHEFRINAAHRGQQVQKLIDEYGIDRASLKVGWGILLDKFYDDLGEALENINITLEKVLKDHND